MDESGQIQCERLFDHDENSRCIDYENRMVEPFELFRLPDVVNAPCGDHCSTI